MSLKAKEEEKAAKEAAKEAAKAQMAKAESLKAAEGGIATRNDGVQCEVEGELVVDPAPDSDPNKWTHTELVVDPARISIDGGVTGMLVDESVGASTKRKADEMNAEEPKKKKKKKAEAPPPPQKKKKLT